MSASVPSAQLGAIILCGGKSTRMGFDKSQLLLEDGRTFLERIIATLKTSVENIVVVRNDKMPDLQFSEVKIVPDRNPDCGPLEGIASGLAAMPSSVSTAFVTSCDVPLIRAEVISILDSELEDADGVTPIDGSRVYGLTAIYRKRILPRLDRLINDRMLKVADLQNHTSIKQIPLEKIRQVDPQLESLRNINSFADYQQLAQKLGFEIPDRLAAKLRRS